MNAQIGEDAQEDHERNGYPSFRIAEQFHCLFRQLLSASLTAAITALSAGVVPISRSTMALAASAAMLRTFAMAACLEAPMIFSASASLALSCSSSFLRVAAVSAACLSRISPAIRRPPGPGFTKSFFEARRGRVGLRLKGICLRQVFVNPILPLRNNTSDARQCDFCHQRVEQHES